MSLSNGVHYKCYKGGGTLSPLIHSCVVNALTDFIFHFYYLLFLKSQLTSFLYTTTYTLAAKRNSLFYCFISASFHYNYISLDTKLQFTISLTQDSYATIELLKLLEDTIMTLLIASSISFLWKWAVSQ